MPGKKIVSPGFSFTDNLRYRYQNGLGDEDRSSKRSYSDREVDFNDDDQGFDYNDER